MTIDHCSYHNHSSATWQCRACDRYFGDCCVSKSMHHLPRCVLCSRDLQSLGAANVITPFWNILHKFLIYPLKLSPLLLLVFLGILANLASYGLLGLAIGLGILIISTRYAYAIIDETACGRLKPPGLSVLFTADDDKLFLKQIAVFFVMGAAIGAVSLTESGFLVFLATMFCTLALPASILVLATEKSIAAAVNPILLIQLMTRLGVGYFVLYAFINILGSGPVVVTEILSDFLPERFVLPVFIFTTVYFWFASAYMMGYALLQYQKEIGYRADIEQDTIEAVEQSDIDDIQKQLTILIIEGRFDDAYSMLKEAVRKAPHNVLLQQRFNKLLMAMGRANELQKQSEGLIAQLLEENMLSLAADTYENVVSLIPEFELDAAEHLVKIAGVYRDRNRYSNALSLLSQLTKRFPDYPDQGAIILQAAKIYAENMNRPDKAVPLARYVTKSTRFDDQIRDEAGKLLKILSV